MNTLLSRRRPRNNNVMTKLKGTYIQFRVREDVKDDLQKVAEIRGLTMSGLIHSMVVNAIREEKERDPAAFQRTVPANNIPHGTLKLGKRKTKTG
jgi:hypothetical protein